MDTISIKKFQYLHLVLGIFFTAAGIFTLFKADYIYSIWIILLGFFFLFDIFRHTILSGFRPVILNLTHYFLAITVLIFGLITLFK
jgi:hypothetical protein